VPRRNQGLGRILVMVYAVFALSSFARSIYQILVHFDEAPLAYVLSAFAAAVYIVATLSLARSGRTAWYVSLVAVGIELVGVVAIGLWTVLDPQLFADDTVWSRFGAGYGYIPLVLPVIGMLWLLTHRPDPRLGGHDAGRSDLATRV
jgi:amino acid transporter